MAGPLITSVTVNIGSNNNDGTGDTLRSAFDKVNTALSLIYQQASVVLYSDIPDVPTVPPKDPSVFAIYHGYVNNSWYAWDIGPAAWFVVRPADAVTLIVVDDGTGNFWELVASTSGRLGTVSTTGPATSDNIIDDGTGNFWKVKVDVNGLRGVVAVAGPATPPAIVKDSSNNLWQLTVTPSGQLGIVSV